MRDLPQQVLDFLAKRGGWAATIEYVKRLEADHAELIEACHKRDEAQGQYDLAEEFYGEDSNHKEMRAARGRIRKAVKRYVALLARATPTHTNQCVAT